MSDKLEDTSLRLKDEMDLYKKMMDKLRQNRLHFQKERDATQELIEDLRKELEHLQLFKLDCERPGRGRSSSSSMSEFNAKARELELEQEMRRMKMVMVSCVFGRHNPAFPESPEGQGRAEDSMGVKVIYYAYLKGAGPT
ncbi:hypothetical protein FKM82_007946 [Ascaphus truei]